jgi:MFS family permease
MDRAVLAVLLESIKRDFVLTDSQLGLLSGISFAFSYSALGIPVAAFADRSNRKRLLAAAIGLWSVMTALCGRASNFTALLLGRAGTAAGEAGGSSPSQSIISDYFPPRTRSTALAMYAVAVPVGLALGNYLGGMGNDHFGWRMTFILMGLPGILFMLIVLLTVVEPTRGMSDGKAINTTQNPKPPIREAIEHMCALGSFRHVCLGAALHSIVWYSGSQLNASFLQRSHGMTAQQSGGWLAVMSTIGALGTLMGGYMSDRLSVRMSDRRWQLWTPGVATLAMVPFQFCAYLSNTRWLLLASFGIMTALAAFFFGPSWAIAQELAPLRMRAIATSLLLFAQTIIGQGLGPYLAGTISDHLQPLYGRNSLRYALALLGLINLWAAIHYFRGARALRRDLHLVDATAAAENVIRT